MSSLTPLPSDPEPVAGAVGLERLPATVYVFRLAADGTASFPYVSPACAALYGFSPEEAMADVNLMHEAVHVEDRPGFHKAGQLSMSCLLPLRWEGRIVRRDGSEQEVLITSQPARGSDGTTEWTGVVTERASRGAADVALSADTMPELHADALAMMAHDVAGPLTAMIASTEWALEDISAATPTVGPSPDLVSLRRRLQVILRQAYRISELRDDLLAMAASDAAVIRAEPVAVDVLAYLRAAADRDGEGVRLIVECVPEMFCYVQPSHLAQMLSNLVSNALRYADSEVSLSATLAGQRVLITVRDDGPGVSPEVAVKLFRRFSHAGVQTRPAGAGTGLGLYIVRTLAHANDGTVLFTPGESGTRFTIAVPAAPRPG